MILLSFFLCNPCYLPLVIVWVVSCGIVLHMDYLTAIDWMQRELWQQYFSRNVTQNVSLLRKQSCYCLYELLLLFSGLKCGFAFFVSWKCDSFVRISGIIWFLVNHSGDTHLELLFGWDQHEITTVTKLLFLFCWLLLSHHYTHNMLSVFLLTGSVAQCVIEFGKIWGYFV